MDNENEEIDNIGSARTILYTDEFKEFYNSLDERSRKRLTMLLC
ncbi:hypothetical protein M2132_002470 [Dysgonomonas sp. PH5-45]|nr:hypothetical protein [Dysgonomonas sp. PH5-45]MDH6389008.1 hypothetical protein [Dysgonomonas sp. PH5-37]